MQARKRRRSDSSEEGSTVEDAKRVLVDEFNLEISMRERINETIESRITWALMLQELLQKESSNGSTDTTLQFKGAALDALDAIESPSNFILNRELPHPVHPPSLRSLSPSSVIPSSSRPVTRPVTRPPSSTAPSSQKLLFIRNSTSSPGSIARMVCSDCRRSDFTNLQGLLNHCRLRHKREYGSHDECMQQCAVLVSDAAEAEWVIKNGTELSGVSIPSLKQLFETAVGGIEHVAAKAEGPNVVADARKDDGPGTYLSRTLGHHKDTPALAPFLGRAPKKRRINVDEPVTMIDIVNQDRKTGHTRWRMPYTHRNPPHREFDADVDLLKHTPPQALSTEEEARTLLPLTKDVMPAAPPHELALRTRFHILARIGVCDYSLWVSPERRAHDDQTHRWMLSVDSPSYSLDITSFLAEMTVTCISDPPPSAFPSDIIVSRPPFFASGTTDRPFLARLRLSWIGDHNPPTEVEHWVDVDPFKMLRPVLGEQQVLDIELDRNTTLLPIRPNDSMTAWGQECSGEALPTSTPSSHDSPDQPPYAVLLSTFLPRFPMTMKDVKDRRLLELPYRLVATPLQLRRLVPGRRKAIEWGRAMALRKEYHDAVGTLPETDQITLSTADVYRWLQDEGHFPRDDHPNDIATKAEISKQRRVLSFDGWCPACGLQYLYHGEAVKAETPDGGSFACDIASIPRGPPLLDFNDFLTTPVTPSQPRTSTLHFDSTTLIATAEPSFITATRRIIAPLKLSCFPSEIEGDDNFPLEKLGSNKTNVVDNLAPYGLMSLLTRSFLEVLVKRGLAIAAQDASGAQEGRRRRRKSQLLTPSHIIRGLGDISGVHASPTHQAALKCIARLGVTSESVKSISVHRRPTPSLLPVKLEDTS
ncbi:hypothetical protein PLICRDRAFT_55615 [Plicaturopsis crispa FD-325 SS-3]|nr:hypothetical protein PLICRDRAFT_55615 [Plicaturopsis crispa FD-325 SS-3]